MVITTIKDGRRVLGFLLCHGRLHIWHVTRFQLFCCSSLNHKNRNQHDNLRAAIGFTLPLQHRRTSMSACWLAETQGSWEYWWPPLSFRFMRWFLRDGSSRVPQRFLLFKTQSSENCTTKTRQKMQKEDELSRACQLRRRALQHFKPCL